MTKILFIEDDDITIDGVVSFLRVEGVHVEIVSEVAEALRLLRYDTFNVIFIDVMLPPGEEFTLAETSDGRYTGLSLLERVKEDERFKLARQAEFYLITNWREEPRIDVMASKYGVKVLRKPLAINMVREILE